MQLHQLKPKHKLKGKKRVGRGGKRGTYSGRGMKGQKSRSGRRLAPVIREVIKRYPKLRGYKFNPKAKTLKTKVAVLNLSLLEKKFNSGDEITPKLLLEKKIIRRIKGRTPRLKILGGGELKKSLLLKGCSVSKSAEEKIKKAGGAIN